jgi:hypothetical protein
MRVILHIIHHQAGSMEHFDDLDDRVSLRWVEWKPPFKRQDELASNVLAGMLSQILVRLQKNLFSGGDFSSY